MYANKSNVLSMFDFSPIEILSNLWFYYKLEFDKEFKTLKG